MACNIIEGVPVLGEDLSDFTGKRVLVRADLNVPMESGRVSDDARLRASLATIQALREAGARVIVMSHMGRPKGEAVAELSLLPVRDEMEKLLGCEVAFANDCIGAEAHLISDNLQNGEVALLENLRFHKGEEGNDKDFAKSLAALADIYVNDGFSVSHRAHGSVEAVTHLLPSCGGLSMADELRNLQRVLSEPITPLAVVIGGAKISTKINTIKNLIDKIDYLIIGGGMANTFLLAEGHDVGNSLVEKDYCDVAREILSMAEKSDVEIVLPVDVVVADSLNSGEGVCKAVGDVGGGDMILDVGEVTVKRIIDIFNQVGTVLWNGPLGAFEHAPFGDGTFAVMRGVVACEGVVSIGGGGDTAYALKMAGVFDEFSYVSLAGGAFLEYLEGKELPGLEALKKHTK